MDYTPHYSSFVAGLFKPGADIHREVSHSDCALLHAALGIAGELGELTIADCNQDRNDVLEQAGDLFFYCRATRNILELEFSSITTTSLHDIVIAAGLSLDKQGTTCEILSACASHVIDDLKRITIYRTAYNKPELKQLNRRLGHLELIVAKILSQYNFTVEQCIQHNIDKLLDRHPKGTFTNAAALAKADERKS